MSAAAFETLYAFTNANGDVVQVRVEIDGGVRLQKLAAKLAQRALASKGGKVASGADGVVRVSVVSSAARVAS